MKYDDAEYCFLNFETGLDNEAGGTHAGMYLAWAARRDLLGDSFDDDRARQELARLRAREITGRTLYFSHCDGKLTDDDLSAEGNAFTADYYPQQFFADYEKLFAQEMPKTGHAQDDFCSVPDTWANCDRLAALLDRRFAQWQRQTGAGRPAGDEAGSPLAAAQGGAPASRPAPTGNVPRSPASAPTPASTASQLPIGALRQRAEAGDADAWYQIGVAHLTGEGASQNMTQAAYAFQRGAELGSAEAAFNLAVCYQHGEGRPKDRKQSSHWFLRAADQGHPEAIFHLALAYRHGDGVEQDVVASNALMLLAQKRGVAQAARAGVMAGSMAENLALYARLGEPGALMSTLQRRRGTARAQPAVDRAGRPIRARVGGWHRGHAALLLGAAAFVILLALAGSLGTTSLRALALALAAVGGYGVFRGSGDLAHGGATRALLTLLALIPVAGSFVCILVLWWTVRARRTG
jgi:TPR repeat protein